MRKKEVLGFLIVITFSGDINPKNDTANCQNDDVWFNDSKFWRRIRRAKISEMSPLILKINFSKIFPKPNHYQIPIF